MIERGIDIARMNHARLAHKLEHCAGLVPASFRL